MAALPYRLFICCGLFSMIWSQVLVPRRISSGVPSMTHTSSFTETIESEQTTPLEMEGMKSLFNELFGAYDPLLRPRLDLQDAVVVTTKFVPETIIDFDTRDQIFTVSGYYQFEWRDEVLANTTSFNGTLKISSSVIWIPSVRIKKRVTSTSSSVGDQRLDFLAVRTNGSVQWVPEGIYSFLCEVDIKYYPFDVQTCTLTYFVEGETSAAVDLHYHGKVDLSEYAPNAEWDLISATQETRHTDNITHIDLHFKVKRRGSFEATTIVSPVIIMSMLSGLAFLLPISSGEKGTISIMIFFAYTIFMTVLVEYLPHNSLHVSYLVVFVVYLLCGSIVLVVYAILQHKLHSDVTNGVCPVVYQALLPRCYRGRGNMRADVSETWEGLFRAMDFYVCVTFMVVNTICTSVFLSLILH